MKKDKKVTVSLDVTTVRKLQSKMSIDMVTWAAFSIMHYFIVCLILYMASLGKSESLYFVYAMLGVLLIAAVVSLISSLSVVILVCKMFKLYVGKITIKRTNRIKRKFTSLVDYKGEYNTVYYVSLPVRQRVAVKYE